MRLHPTVNASKYNRLISIYIIELPDKVFKKKIGISRMQKANEKLMAFDATIESGITDLGKKAFFMRERSYTIEGVALVSEREKKFHTNKPLNKW